MTSFETLALDEIERLSAQALIAAGTSAKNAEPLAVATAATEADGIASHGMAYIPIYASHVQCGKVDGAAIPTMSTPKPSVITVDAATGFAHPAIDLGFEHLIPLARTQGVAVLAIKNSYNCGVLGYHTHRLAQAGMLGIGFTNAPASIAPSGGQKPLIGTNPVSIAAPDATGGAAVLIDQSASAIARSEVMKHAREGKQIPLGWALDKDGTPTTDPNAALQGSMAPSGGYKGVGIGLMVEIMAAAMTGATLGIDASPFSGTVGGPPKTGQFFICIDPASTSGGLFTDRINQLLDAAHAQEGARIPGQQRSLMRDKAHLEGVAINSETLAKVRAIASG